MTEVKDSSEPIGEKSHSSLYRSSLERVVRIGVHDLNESLRMVSTYLGLLNREIKNDLNDEQRSYLDYALEGSARLGKLIEALGKYARASTTSLRVDQVNLEEVFHSLQKKWDAISPRPIQWNFPVMPTLSADPELVFDLFDRLFSNAIKFTPSERPIHVAVQVNEIGNGVRVEVSDRGMGIPSDSLLTLFEPFRRLHSRKEFPGVGMGLAYAKAIVDRHRGKIEISSTVNEGTTVSVFLPDAGLVQRSKSTK